MKRTTSKTIFFEETVQNETENEPQPGPSRRPVAAVQPTLRMETIEMEARRFERGPPPQRGQPAWAYGGRPVSVVHPTPRFQTPPRLPPLDINNDSGESWGTPLSGRSNPNPRGTPAQSPPDQRMLDIVAEVDHVREDLRQVRNQILGTPPLNISHDSNASWGTPLSGQSTPLSWRGPRQSPTPPSPPHFNISHDSNASWGTPLSGQSTPLSWRSPRQSPRSPPGSLPASRGRSSPPSSPDSWASARSSASPGTSSSGYRSSPRTPVSYPSTPESWPSTPRQRGSPDLYATPPGLSFDDSLPSSPEELVNSINNMVDRVHRLERALTVTGTGGYRGPIPAGIRERLRQSQMRVTEGLQRLDNIIDERYFQGSPARRH